MNDIVQRLRMIVASGNGGPFEEHLMEAAEEIERLRESQEWIAVGDRLPDTQESVLVCLASFVDKKGMPDVCEAIHRKDAWFSVGDYGTYEATHWRPLPPPPAAG
jgi:hypothetical protein